MKNNIPAFPVYIGEQYSETYIEGMSLRDYFAAKAMQGILSNTNLIYQIAEINIKYIIEKSYAISDAMIAERENYDPLL